MNAIYREYQTQDYADCEVLVNEAWGFDRIFQPPELAAVAKQMYTQGGLLASNHCQVVEVDGKVVGFIFGFNERGPRVKRNYLFGLQILWRLYRIHYPDVMPRKHLLQAIGAHQQNRQKHLPSGKSEICLFVVAKAHQGQGHGTQLWGGFRESCIGSGVTSVWVETNEAGAAGFYRGLGFQHVADFDSPLHAYATPEGQACIYRYADI